MKHHRNLWLLAALALAVWTLSGCSPTQLGNSMFKGKVKDVLQDDATLEARSEAEKLFVKIQITAANVCEGEFKLMSQSDAYPPILSMADLTYGGHWKANQSPECQKQIGGPGGQQRRVMVKEPKFPASIFNDPILVVCSAGTDTLCIPKNTISFEKAGM